MACQSKVASSGPFTATVTSRRLTCPRVPGLRSSSSPQAHLTASARFRARAPGPVSGQLCGTAGLEEPAITSRFPVAFPLPAFASRSSDSRRGTGPSSRSAYRTRLPGPRRGLPRFARTSYERGGCLLCPGDGGALPGWAGFPTSACRFAAASPCAPLQHPIGGADRNETSVGGLSSSPVRSASRLWPPDGTGALGLLPELRTPPGTPATHVRPRPGHEHGPGTTPSILSNLQSACSLICVRPRVADPSGLPLACGPRMERAALGL